MSKFLTIYFAVYTIFVILISFWTDRNLDFWASHFAGEARDVPFFLSILVSLFAPFAVVANLIGEVLRFFV